MKILLVGIFPNAGVGLAPYYLKAYCDEYMDPEIRYEMPIREYDVCADENAVVNDIFQMRPNVVGFSCYIWNRGKIMAIADKLKDMLPEMKIILGGPDISPIAEETMRHHTVIDFTVVGEGEITFYELIRHLIQGSGSRRDIQGLVHREGTEIRVNPPRPPIQHIDAIPSPFLKKTINLNRLNGYLYSYETYRGCPFACRFCYWGKTSKVRYFSMERIKAELALILHSPVRRIWLSDSTANLNTSRFKEFLKVVIDSRTRTVIDFEMMAELLDDETIALLGKLQDGYIAFGLQAIHPQTLANINRKWDRQKFEKNIRRLRLETRKIKIYIDLIYGLPGDNYERYVEAIRYAMSLRPNKIQSHPFLVLPGSEFYDHPEPYGLVYHPESPHYVMESNTFSQMDMTRAAEWTDRLLFYFNPAVNLTVNLISEILEMEPFDVLAHLLGMLPPEFDLHHFHYGIENGIRMDYVFRLNHLLTAFIGAQLSRNDSHRLYAAPLMDAVTFHNYRTMFYFQADEPPRTHAVRPPDRNMDRNMDWMQILRAQPRFHEHIVFKTFDHDLSAIYQDSKPLSAEMLLQFPRVPYTLVFDLRTHSIFYISESVKELLTICHFGSKNVYEAGMLYAMKNRLPFDDTLMTAIIPGICMLHESSVLAMQ